MRAICGGLETQLHPFFTLGLDQGCINLKKKVQPPQTSRRHCTKFSRPRPGAQDLCIRALLDGVNILLHDLDALTPRERDPGIQ